MLETLANLTTSASPVSGGTEALLIGGVVALGQAVSELVKALIAAINKRKNGGANEPRGCITCQDNVKRVVQVISHADGDGVPLIYGGHQIGKKLDRVADELAAVSRKLDKETM